jgi:hypothetical protein
MNLQRRSEERSKALHKKIARKLRENPDLWNIPFENLKRWRRGGAQTPSAQLEWERILRESESERVLALLESDSEESVRLRSSSPFTGILTEAERNDIFSRFRRSSAPDPA